MRFSAASRRLWASFLPDENPRLQYRICDPPAIDVVVVVYHVVVVTTLRPLIVSAASPARAPPKFFDFASPSDSDFSPLPRCFFALGISNHSSLDWLYFYPPMSYSHSLVSALSFENNLYLPPRRHFRSPLFPVSIASLFSDRRSGCCRCPSHPLCLLPSLLFLVPPFHILSSIFRHSPVWRRCK